MNDDLWIAAILSLDHLWSFGMNTLPIWVEYTSALTPAVAVVAASTAAAIALANYWRQRAADREEKFWHRLEWAVAMSASDDLRDANMGMSVLTALVNDDDLDEQDDLMLRGIIDAVIMKVSTKTYTEEASETDET